MSNISASIIRGLTRRVFRRGGRMCLGHRQQGDFGGLTAARPTLRCYSMEQRVSSLAESVVIDKHLGVVLLE